MRLKNISPLGDLEVAWHGVIEAGQEFDVLAEHVVGLIRQRDNFEPADDEAHAALAAADAEDAKPVEAVEPAPTEAAGAAVEPESVVA